MAKKKTSAAADQGDPVERLLFVIGEHLGKMTPPERRSALRRMSRVLLGRALLLDRKGVKR